MAKRIEVRQDICVLYSFEGDTLMKVKTQVKAGLIGIAVIGQAVGSGNAVNRQGGQIGLINIG